jgi:GDP-D-mannose 3', 5'-epimerase
VKKALITGAGGFIGHHLVNRLKERGYWVRGVDIKRPEFGETAADEFLMLDLREREAAEQAFTVQGGFDDTYALAADMGGMGFISAHHAEIIHSNLLINLNSVHAAADAGVGRYLYTSSACVYPSGAQQVTDVTPLREDQAYPADPEDAYGWEKLTSEKIVHYYNMEGRLPVVRSVRFHNVYGPLGTWDGGREKAPAALCRKIAVAVHKGGSVEMWGDGEQTRSFMHIDDCIEGLEKIMDAEGLNDAPVNLGRDRMVSINELAQIIANIAGMSELVVEHIDGPQGVRGRNSDNTFLNEVLGWEPSITLEDGLRPTYEWIEQQAKTAGLLG